MSRLLTVCLLALLADPVFAAGPKSARVMKTQPTPRQTGVTETEEETEPAVPGWARVLDIVMNPGRALRKMCKDGVDPNFRIPQLLNEGPDDRQPPSGGRVFMGPVPRVDERLNGAIGP